MNGEIDFKESLRRRVALLEGTSVEVLEQVKRCLTFTEGAHFLCRALKKLGFKLAVISGKCMHVFTVFVSYSRNNARLSGGFMPLALYVKAELGLDYAFANQVRTCRRLNYSPPFLTLLFLLAQGILGWQDFDWRDIWPDRRWYPQSGTVRCHCAG